MMIGGEPVVLLLLDVTVAAAIAVVEVAAVDDRLLVLMSCVLEVKLDSATVDDDATELD